MKSNLSKFLKNKGKLQDYCKYPTLRKVRSRITFNPKSGTGRNSRMDKVNEILKLFGYVLYPTEINNFLDLNEKQVRFILKTS